MVPFSVFSEQLPVISAKNRIEASTLSSLLTGVSAAAAPHPTGAHLPGAILSAGFGLVKEAYFANLDAGKLEKLRGDDELDLASVTFETTDTAGSADVSAAGQAVLTSTGQAIADDIFGN